MAEFSKNVVPDGFETFVSCDDIDFGRLSNVIYFATKRPRLDNSEPDGKHFFVTKVGAHKITPGGAVHYGLKRKGLSNVFMPTQDHKGWPEITVTPGQGALKGETAEAVSALQNDIEGGVQGSFFTHVSKHLAVGRGSEYRAAKLTIAKMTICDENAERSEITTLKLLRTVRDIGCRATQTLCMVRCFGTDTIGGSHLGFEVMHEGNLRPVQDDNPWVCGQYVDEAFGAKPPLAKPISEKQWTSLVQQPLTDDLFIVG